MANSWGLSAGVVIVYLSAAPAYGDTIYTCASRNGVPLLQNMPCDTGSEVSVQKDMREAKSVPLPPGGAQAAARAPTDTAAAHSDELANLPSEPALGMTKQQVRAILGAPTAITQEEASQGIEMTWIYGDSRALQFDTSGRLSKK